MLHSTARFNRFLAFICSLGSTVGALTVLAFLSQLQSPAIDHSSDQSSERSPLKQAVLTSCGHRLISVEGGRVSRRSRGQGSFQAIGGTVGLCSNDILSVPPRVQARVRCAGSSRAVRFFRGQNAVRRLCGTSGFSANRGSSTTLISLPYATHVASPKPKLLVYVAATDSPNSRNTLSTTLQILNPNTFEFALEQPIEVALEDLSYRPDPTETEAAGAPMGIYDGVILLDTAEFEEMQALEAGVDYEWVFAEDAGDGEVTAFTKGLLHYQPYPDNFDPAQTAQADPKHSYGWLLDNDYGGEALALIAQERLRPRRSLSALTQWQTVLSALDRSDKDGQDIETRLRQTEIIALP